MDAMSSRSKFSKFIDSPFGETLLFVFGVVLVIVGFAVAPLPGPGGIFFLAPGLALILKTSMWAKRNYVRLKRWQPRAGHWIDWGLRRQSARRRIERSKQMDSQAEAPSD